MNWQNFHSKLNKINLLTQSAENDGQLSRLEKDLLGSYIRELYDVLMEGDFASQPLKNGGFQSRRIPQEEHFVETIIKTVTPPVVKEEPKAVEVPVMKEESPYAEVVGIKEEPKLPPASIEKTPEKEEEISKPSVTPMKENVPVSYELLEELFAEEKVADLSGKLASQKIPDLTKAMGINEKIFTIQELFNNDNSLFNNTLSHLNTLPDFQSAKSYLANDLVPRLDWTSDKKIKKASTFIKLIRRRYMS